MPHIVKWQEKRQCVRPVAEQTARVLAVPQQFYSVLEDLPTRYSDYTTKNKRTLFNLIENIISDTMKSNWTDGNFFNEFVDIKEVPYGRYNSDSDYRGS